MPKAHQLPSGSWNVTAYAGKDENGKRKYESFTAPTRKEAELLAAQWAYSRSVRPEAYTVQEAVTKYIDSHASVLSPASVVKFRGILRRDFSRIATVPLRRMTSAQAQTWVNTLSESLSPKSVSCAWSLLISTLAQYAPDMALHVKLPRRIPSEIQIPTRDEVAQMIAEAPEDFRPVLVIASSMGLRRGEIAALTWGDVHDGLLSISRAWTKGPDGLVLRAPKTNAGIRTVPIPPSARPYLTRQADTPDDTPIIPLTPDAITRRFERLMARLSLPYRFHALRHYYDSVLLALGVPERYIMARMGHATPNMTRLVYSHIMRDREAQITDEINNYFTDAK